MAMIAAWVLFAVNVVAWVVFPPPPLDAGDQRAPDAIQRDLRLAIATTAAEVDGWRALNSSRLPPTLEAAGMSERAFEYSVVDSVTFDLAGSDGGVRLSYRSSTPLVDFLTAGAAVRP